MIKALALEYFKIRRKKVWLMLTLFLIAELVWASMSMSISISRSPDNATWEALIFTLSSMNGLFLPIISAIIVSRICDMEHKGSLMENAYDNLYRPQSRLCSQVPVCQQPYFVRHRHPGWHLSSASQPSTASRGRCRCLCFCISLPERCSLIWPSPPCSNGCHWP